jgi:hypothetical protein
MFSHIEAAISLIKAAPLSCTFFYVFIKKKWNPSPGLSFFVCGMLSPVIIYTCEQRNKNKSRQIILKAHENLKA